MKKAILFTALAASAGLCAAQEVGRVISSTPVVQQVPVPRQVCANQPVATQGPTSGGGALLGAIVGGVIGHTIGGGMGTVAATGLGIIGGAAVGDHIEGQNSRQVQNVAQCSTQTFFEPRTVAYNVVYEYGGRQYSVQMPQDPGPTLQLQVRPQGALDVPPVAAAPAVAAPAYAEVPPAVYAPPVRYVVADAAPVVVSPVYYAPAFGPYYSNVGVTVGYYGYGHRRHWR